MKIVKATLQNAARNRWKFALVVFLFGVGLAALTNAYDMSEGLERLRAVDGEMESEGTAPSGEQVETMMGSAAMLVLFSLLNIAFGFGAIIFAFVMPGGMVANERRNGTIMLWAQHPMHLRSFYMQRYLGIQFATLVALVIFGLTGALAVLTPGAAPTTGPGRVVSVCLTGVLACGISFAITTLGIRRAALIGLVYYLPSGFLWSLIEDPGLGTASTLELARAVLPFVIFPDGAVENLVAGFESGVAWDWGATGLVLYHFVLWTAIAWLGLGKIQRQPLAL